MTKAKFKAKIFLYFHTVILILTGGLQFSNDLTAGTIGPFSYQLHKDTATITRCSQNPNQDETLPIIIPEIIEGKKVTRIAEHAFRYTKAKTVVIPKYIECIEPDALSDMVGLQKLTIDTENPFFKSTRTGLYSSDFLVLHKYIPDSKEKFVSLETGLEVIANGAFSNINSIEQINIPETVFEIGERAFDSCYNLKVVKLPPRVKTIKQSTFLNCENLVEVQIPNSVVSLGAGSFTRCRSLKNIRLPQGIKFIGPACFQESGITSIQLPEELYVIPKKAFTRCKNLIEVRLGPNIHKISKGAFQECGSLESINFPISIRHIDDYAFYKSKIYLPPSHFDLIIGQKAFPIHPDLIDAAEYQMQENIHFWGAEYKDKIWGGQILNETILVDLYQPTDRNITVPNSINGLPVVGISDRFSRGIPTEGVLWPPPFLPVDTIHLGKHVKYTGRSKGLRELMKFTVDPENNHITAIDGVLYSKDMKRLMHYPANKPDLIFTVLESVESIDEYAFAYAKNLQEISFPQQLRSIGSQAFRGCRSLKEVHLPEGLESIGNSAFADTGITIFTAPHSVTDIGMDMVANARSTNKNIKFAQVPSFFKTQGFNANTLFVDFEYNNAFYEFTGESWRLKRIDETLQQFTIPESIRGFPVNEIASGAFSNCPRLEILELSNIIGELPVGGFSGLGALITIKLGNQIQFLPEYIFQDCTKLQTVDGLDRVIYMGNLAFDNCLSLKSLTLRPLFHSPEQINRLGLQFLNSEQLLFPTKSYNGLTFKLRESGWSIVGSSQDLKNAIVPVILESLPIVEIEKGAFRDRKNLETVSFVENSPSSNKNIGITKFGDEVFSGCSNLSIIKIPSSVKEIGKACFADCPKLEAVLLPEGIVTLAEETFKNCTSLNAIEFPSTILFLEKECFRKCSTLGSVKIPDNVVFIADSTFQDCTMLETVNIPQKVTYLGISAFENCTSLQTVQMPTSWEPQAINARLFYSCKSLSHIKIPDATTAIAANAFENCKSLNQISLPSSLQYIWNNAFKACDSLAKVYMHETVSLEISSFDPGTELSTYDESISFSLDNQGLHIRKYNYAIPSKLILPNNFFNLPIVGIFDDLFAYSLLTEIVLPIGIRRIGGRAFMKSPLLNTVRIKSNFCFIDNYAFADCIGLENIILASEHVVASENSFKNCPVLTSIETPHHGFEIAKSEASYLGTRQAWSEKPDLQIPSTIVGFPVTKIKNDVFANPVRPFLVSVKLPEKCKQIGENAFKAHVTLEQITLSDELTDIGKTAFAGTSLKSLNLPDGIKSISKDTFRDCVSLQDITLPPFVQSIEDSAFRGCVKLNKLEWPQELISIGPFAFYQSGITEFFDDLPNLLRIGEMAFSKCDYLESVNISKSVEEIGIGSFSYCKMLKAIACSPLNAHFESRNGVLFDVSNRSLLQFPSGKPDDHYEIPDDTGSISKSAFAGCNYLINLSIPVGVELIENNAFTDCHNLQIVKIGSKYHIDTEAVRIGLFDHYPDKFQFPTIESEDFTFEITPFGLRIKNCHLANPILNIPKVYDSKEIIEIGNFAFRNSKNLLVVHIPDSINKIGEGAFEDCDNLVEVTLPDSLITISENAFRNCPNLVKIELPSNLENIGKSAFEGCSGLSNLEIPDNVAVLEEKVFRDCISLTDIKFGLGSRTIKGGAFYGCISLKQLFLPSQINSIGVDAFGACENLEVAIIPREFIYANTLRSIGLNHLWPDRLIASEDKPIGAQATARIINGFVVAADIIQSGQRYLSDPAVEFIGGGGTGAAGLPVVNQGKLIQIQITNAGQNYTSAPAIRITPPQGFQAPKLLIKLGKSTFYIRNQATAIGQIFNGFLIGAKITNAGRRYKTVPFVTIQGGGGHGATARAVLTDDKVTEIIIDSAGFGYTDLPDILIEPPVGYPAEEPTMITFPILSANGTDGDIVFIESASNIIGPWEPAGTFQLSKDGNNEINLPNNRKTKMFYRLKE